MQASDSLLYGMTVLGGTYGAGVIFSYNISAGSYTDLHNFGNLLDGEYPNGSLIELYNNMIYGMTYNGGVYGEGIIFNYNILTKTYEDIYNFGGVPNDAYNPLGSLMTPGNGILYGLTWAGSPFDNGALFSYDTATGRDTVLHAAARPNGSLIQASNGLLYGMNFVGGAHDDGDIFSYNISTGTYSEACAFNVAQGIYSPIGDLLEVDLPTAINPPLTNNLLEIFPNPTTNKIEIDMQHPISSSLQIAIMDVAGQTLMHQTINPDVKSEIDVSALPAGIYFIQLQDGQQSLVRKFVKE